jgi:hypothetical protein
LIGTHVSPVCVCVLFLAEEEERVPAQSRRWIDRCSCGQPSQRYTEYHMGTQSVKAPPLLVGAWKARRKTLVLGPWKDTARLWAGERWAVCSTGLDVAGPLFGKRERTKKK